MGVVAPIPLAIGYEQIVFYAQIVAKKRAAIPVLHLITAVPEPGYYY